MSPATQKRRRLFVETLRQAGQLPGVRPASTREILDREAARPLTGRDDARDALPLFGMGARNQLKLI